jgi:hypothetical protein
MLKPRRCPLYPRKRTFAHAIRMSALGHKQTLRLISDESRLSLNIRHWPALVARQCDYRLPSRLSAQSMWGHHSERECES